MDRKARWAFLAAFTVFFHVILFSRVWADGVAPITDAAQTQILTEKVALLEKEHILSSRVEWWLNALSVATTAIVAVFGLIGGILAVNFFQMRNQAEKHVEAISDMYAKASQVVSRLVKVSQGGLDIKAAADKYNTVLETQISKLGQLSQKAQVELSAKLKTEHLAFQQKLSNFSNDAMGAATLISTATPSGLQSILSPSLSPSKSINPVIDDAPTALFSLEDLVKAGKIDQQDK